jgi:hypothetical protein
MPLYKITGTLTFNYEVTVKAKNIEKALAIEEKDFSPGLLREAHTSNDSHVIDWDVDMHADERTVKIIKPIKKK